MKQKNKQPDHTTEEGWEDEFRRQFCRVGSKTLLNSLDDGIGEELARQIISFISGELKSERKKLTKQIINEIAVMVVDEGDGHKAAGQIIKMIKEKALND